MKTQNWIARINHLGIDVIDKTSGFGICQIGTYGELEDANYPLNEAIYNAKIIASSRELLSALESAKKELDQIKGHFFGNRETSILECMSNCEKAIKKALS